MVTVSPNQIIYYYYYHKEKWVVQIEKCGVEPPAIRALPELSVYRVYPDLINAILEL